MTRIPDKPNRPSGSVQTRIAGRQEEISGDFDRITNDARDSEKGRRKKRRRRPTGRRHRKTVFLQRWLVLGLGLCGAWMAGLLVWTLFNQNQVPAGRSAGNAPELPVIGPIEGMDLVTRMLAADTPESLASVIADDGLAPDQALRELDDARQRFGGFEEPLWYGPIDSSCIPVSIVLLPTGNGPPLLVPLAPDENTRWRIDLRAMLGHCSPPLGDWAEDRVTEGTVRMIGRRGFYYNGYFRDDERWACFALTHPEADATLYAYCLRDSLHFRAVEDMLRRKTTSGESLDNGPVNPYTAQQTTFRGILRLRRAKIPIGLQYEIEEVVADEWVEGPVPLEELIRSSKQIR